MAAGGSEKENKLEFSFNIDGRPCSLVLNKEEGIYKCSFDGAQPLKADIRQVNQNVFSIFLGRKSYKIYVAKEKNHWSCYCCGRHYLIREIDNQQDVSAEGAGSSQEELLKIKAPMPGKVIQIVVEPGQTVKKNQTLAVVEAMKMENEIKAGLDATVKKIHAQAGDLVDSEKVLIELKESPRSE